MWESFVKEVMKRIFVQYKINPYISCLSVCSLAKADEYCVVVEF